MTREEYEKKRDSYSTSIAPQEVIDEAIRKLDREYYAFNQAQVQFTESQADTDDIG